MVPDCGWYQVILGQFSVSELKDSNLYFLQLPGYQTFALARWFTVFVTSICAIKTFKYLGVFSASVENERWSCKHFAIIVNKASKYLPPTVGTELY